MKIPRVKSSPLPNNSSSGLIKRQPLWIYLLINLGLQGINFIQSVEPFANFHVNDLNIAVILRINAKHSLKEKILHFIPPNFLSLRYGYCSG